MSTPLSRAAVPSTRRGDHSTNSTTPRSSTATTQGSRQYASIQSQHSKDGDVKILPAHPSSGTWMTTPPITAGDGVWSHRIPVPGSSSKILIFPEAPVEWGGFTQEQWLERFLFVTNELGALVDGRMGLKKYYPTFRLCMVGRSPSEARPAVVVGCSSVDFRSIKRLFSRSTRLHLQLHDISQHRSSHVLGHGAKGTKGGVSRVPELQLVYHRTPFKAFVHDPENEVEDEDEELLELHANEVKQKHTDGAPSHDAELPGCSQTGSDHNLEQERKGFAIPQVLVSALQRFWRFMRPPVKQGHVRLEWTCVSG